MGFDFVVWWFIALRLLVVYVGWFDCFGYACVLLWWLVVTPLDLCCGLLLPYGFVVLRCGTCGLWFGVLRISGFCLFEVLLVRVLVDLVISLGFVISGGGLCLLSFVLC